jgi:hypothetical protein
MKPPVLALAAILGAIGPLLTAADAAELSIAPPSKSGYYAPAMAYVLWDDVYPPAVYGPYLRPVEEVRQLKAQRQPVSVRWWHGHYYNLW